MGALKMVFGSPPGLSRTQMRSDRDACKAPPLPSTAWSGSQELTSPARSGKRQTARESLTKLKQEATLLKDVVLRKKVSETKVLQHSQSDATMGQQCRFGSTPLGYPIDSSEWSRIACIASRPVPEVNAT